MPLIKGPWHEKVRPRFRERQAAVTRPMPGGDMLRDTSIRSEPGFDLFDWGGRSFIDETADLVNADHAPPRLNRSALCQHTYPMVEPVAASSSGMNSSPKPRREGSPAFDLGEGTRCRRLRRSSVAMGQIPPMSARS
jgi:hypothetical protein